MRGIARTRLTCFATMAILSAGGCRTMPRWDGGTIAEPVSPGDSIGYTFRAGLASQTFAQPESVVIDAAREAFGDLSIDRLETTARTAQGTSINGRAADGRRVRLVTTALGDQTTASVQIGLFGDEPLSRAVLDRIGIRLGSQPAEAIPAEIPSEPAANPFVARDGVPDSVMYRGMGDAGYRDSPVP